MGIKYAKLPEHERQLAELNAFLEPINEALAGDVREPQLPTVFIIGTPRCGHTLLGQLLITRYRFAYPSNLIARTWRAIGVGARLQRLTLQGVPSSSEASTSAPEAYESYYGATPGLLGLHEFGYFWTDHLQFGETHALTPLELERVDTARLLRDIALLEQEGGQLPTLFKNGTLGFQIGWLARLLPKSVFVHCRRSPLHVAQSILRMRQERAGHKERWFSFKPPETPELLTRPYWEQIAGQIAYTLKQVTEQLRQVPTHRWLELHYEDFCAEPQMHLHTIAEMVASQGSRLEILSEIPKRIPCRKRQIVDDHDYALLRTALTEFGLEV